LSVRIGRASLARPVYSAAFDRPNGRTMAATRKVLTATTATGLGDRLACLRELERKVLWLSAWMIHHANHVRPSRDGLKVGGHQASSASVVTLMSALYFDVLRPEDRVAVKPHAGPVFHAIQYLLGRLDSSEMEGLRAYGGLQPYPSRTKDPDDVDFSTGSVGLGAAMTVFASLVQDYVRLKGFAPPDPPEGRMVALVGDAELDEGNVFEALLEGWKHELRNCWWIVDYNRQSLDSVIADRLFARIDLLFEAMGWRVVTLKYGKRLEAAFQGPGGGALRDWIDACPNALYAALTFKGGAGWRAHLKHDIGDASGVCALLDAHDDAALARLMTNLGGHDMETVLEAFRSATGPEPTCFIAYTIKGWGLPFAGHKDNHAGLMNPEQMAVFKREMGIADGAEWDKFTGLELAPETLAAFLRETPFAARYPRRYATPPVAVPPTFAVPRREHASTQEGFGRILDSIAREAGPLADRIVTTSPDVTVSTNLGPWVNRRGIFARTARADAFAEEHLVSAQRWALSPKGQHFELGIAEHNLFLMLAALGLSGPVFGARVLPVGSLYDPFIRRGLDALHYACYQDARFMLVATPSGLALAPEGGAHQSLETPLITLAQPGIAAFEPAFVDELAVVMRWAFAHMQAEDGGSVCLRLSTRPVAQPDRVIDDGLAGEILTGAYWLAQPGDDCELVIAFSGAVAPEAAEAYAALIEDIPAAGLLNVTSAERLHDDWMAARRARIAGRGDALARVEHLLAEAAPDAALITVIDAHPASLSWLGSVAGHRIYPLGVDRFGQAGDIPDLYRAYGIDADAILDAAARACLRRLA
jgi:pyruvate dehydrogenase E1 component